MPTVSHDKLRAFALELMGLLGASDDEAACVADHLIDANLKGHDSHGVGMLPTYVELVRDGLAYVNREIEVVRDGGAVMTIEGGRGFGQRVARDAIRIGIERAKATGASIIGLRNASHMGRIGTYGEQTVRAGLASIHFVNVADHDPFQSVFGGSDARLGTNPFCAALPMSGIKDGSGDDWVVLDMATSNIAFGKARVARNKGVEVDENCLIDASGRPIRDPVPLVDHGLGALMPFGGHKGSGLAIICEILSSALTGGTSIQPEHPRQGGIVNNMLSIIIDPASMGEGSRFLHEIDAIRDWVTSSPPAVGVDAVLMPGEPEKIAKAERLAHGIPVDDATYAELRNAASTAGLAEPRLGYHLPV